VPRRQDVLRWAAPAAFLAALTIAVLLIRAGLNHNGGAATTPTVAVPTATITTPARATTGTAATTPNTAARYVTVQSGDTYGSIATRNGTSVQQLEQLNPGVSSNSLTVGQKIRVK
jgi:LysM repeat protein